MERVVSIRIKDLKNRLCLYLSEVRRGRTIAMTDHGKPAARLMPLVGESVLEGLIAEGRITPAVSPKRPAGQPLDAGSPVSDLLPEQRG